MKSIFFQPKTMHENGVSVTFTGYTEKGPANAIMFGEQAFALKYNIERTAKNINKVFSNQIPHEITCTFTGYWRKQTENHKPIHGVKVGSWLFIIKEYKVRTPIEVKSTKQKEEKKDPFDFDAWNKIIHPSFKSETLHEEFKILQITKMPESKDELKIIWKSQMKKHHPDAGGTEDMAQKINLAYEKIKNKIPV